MAVAGGEFDASISGATTSVYGRNGVSGTITAADAIDQVFSHGGILANLYAGGGQSSNSGHIGSVQAVGPIDGNFTATRLIDLIRSGGGIEATISAPDIGSIIGNDDVFVTQNPAPDLPAPFAPGLQAEFATLLAELALLRDEMAAQIQELVDEFSVIRQETANEIAVSRDQIRQFIERLKNDAETSLEVKKAQFVANLKSTRGHVKHAIEAVEARVEQAYRNLLAQNERLFLQAQANVTAAENALQAAATTFAEMDTDLHQLREDAIQGARNEFLQRSNDYDAAKKKFQEVAKSALGEWWEAVQVWESLKVSGRVLVNSFINQLCDTLTAGWGGHLFGGPLHPLGEGGVGYDEAYLATNMVWSAWFGALGG